MRYFPLILLLSFFMTSCAGIMKQMIEEPKVKLERIFLKDANFSSTTMVFVLAVENPNKVDIKVDEVKYRVFLNGKDFAEARTDEVIQVAAGSKSNIELPLPVAYNKLWSGITELAFAKTTSYKIEGDAKIALFSIPFSKEGKFDLR